MKKCAVRTCKCTSIQNVVFVPVCAHVHSFPLILPSLLYERRGSERAADVEALTFLVAVARARVKRHPAHESSASTSTCTDPRMHASPTGVVLMNRLTTDHTRYLICSLPLRLQPPELQKSSKYTIKMADMWSKWLCYTLEIGCSKQCY